MLLFEELKGCDPPGSGRHVKNRKWHVCSESCTHGCWSGHKCHRNRTREECDNRRKNEIWCGSAPTSYPTLSPSAPVAPESRRLPRLDTCTSETCDGWRQESHSYELATASGAPESRPRLMYKHFAKAAGTFSIALLEAAVDDVSVKAESGHVDDEVWQTHFVVSGIREPCSWYLSLWAYGTQGFGGLHSRLFDNAPHAAKLLYGKREKRDTSSAFRADVFRRFVVDNYTRGLYASRFLSAFSPRVHADCWVDTNDLVANARACLAKFERQGGLVHWRRLEAFLERDENRTLLDRGTSNAVAHDPCEAYYTDDLKAWLRDASFDAPVFDFFDWPGGCCAQRASRRSGL